MTSGPDERLLRLAEGLVEGRPIDWDELKRREPDLASTLERLRELEAIASAHEITDREDARAEAGGSMKPSERPLFTWGEIQVLEKLGEGGFAEVYRAWDPALEREVALKLSRSGVELAATGIQRWLDEARRLARVRHSNVLVVHGVDVRDSRAGFWTDLIQGRTLEKVLEEQDRLGGAEATLIGLDLCRALAAVHAAGLVHGDLKTSNVMREGHRGSTAEPGRIVLTDFGASSDSSPSASRSPTFVTPLTCAPEVLRGEAPTPVSDLYSLGVLLYRLLTRRYPIESSDLAELETKIQYGHRTPLRDLRPDLGAALVTVVERALDPNPARRFSSAGQMERALSEALAAEGVSTPQGLHAGASPAPGGAERGSRRGWPAAPRAVAGITVLLAAAAIAWWATSRTKPAGPGPIHFEFRGLPNKLIRTDPNQFAISPDGSMLAFIAVDSAGQVLWVWRLRKNESQEIGGTRGAKHPFWSPDGRQIGFFADGKMKRVPLNGGDPEVICDAPRSHGATWGRKGVIVFAPNSQGPLYRVPAIGGTPEVTTPAVDTTRGMNAHAWPSFLPDGEHFTYIERRSEPRILDEPPAKPGPWTSYVGSIRSQRAEPLLVANSAPTFAAPHHLVFIRDGVLLAQDFDVRRRRVKGRATRIADSPDPMAMYGTRCGSASANGVLVWQSFGSRNTRLVWIDRDARRIGALRVAPVPWSRGLISPDGRRAVLRKEEEHGGSNLWVLDLEREVATPLTSGPAIKEPGVWSPDGKEIIYSSRGPGGVCDLHRVAVDRSGSDRLIYRSTGHLQNAFGWSPDGKWVMVQDMREGSGFDLFLVPAEGGEGRPYLTSRFNERRAVISPDGKWVVYCSDEAGPLQAYVQSFPNPGGKQQVSPAPLHGAIWGNQGREIVVVSIDFRVQSIPVQTGKELRLGAARELFSMPSGTRWLAAAPDAQRFLLFEPDEQTTQGRSIAVNVNWTAGLRP